MTLRIEDLLMAANTEALDRKQQSTLESLRQLHQRWQEKALGQSTEDNDSQQQSESSQDSNEAVSAEDVTETGEAISVSLMSSPLMDG